MRILHVQGIFSPEHGGPANSLAQYCIGQASRGHDVSAWVLEGFPQTASAIRLPAPIETVVHRVQFPTALGRSAPMRRALAAVEDPDIFHLHGTWLRAMQYGAAEARRRRVPYLVELMGMYEDYGLRTKWLRKRIARWWFQDKVLHRAQCLHVNSTREGEHLRDLGFEAPLAVIPVGVDMESISDQPLASVPWPELNGRHFFLYLSRIHKKKGIELLLTAWAKLAERFPDWLLVIGGTGPPQYVARCHALAGQLRIANRCRWLGHLSEEQKEWALSKAGFFVLPSFSENFGTIVAEALAHRTPVLTTDTTPWHDLPQQQCGWVVPPTVDALTPALENAMRCEAAQLQQMGELGRRWCEANFSLPRVIEHFESVYAWMTGTGSKPQCVVEI